MLPHDLLIVMMSRHLSRMVVIRPDLKFPQPKTRLKSQVE